MLYKDYLTSSLSHNWIYLRQFERIDDKIYVKLLFNSNVNNTENVDRFNMQCLANRKGNKYILTMHNSLEENSNWGDVFTFYITFEFNYWETFTFVLDNNSFSSFDMVINENGVFLDGKLLKMHTSNYIKTERYSNSNKQLINENQIPSFSIILNDEWDIIRNIVPLDKVKYTILEENHQYILRWENAQIVKVDENLYAFLEGDVGGELILYESPDFVVNNKLETNVKQLSIYMADEMSIS